MHLKRSPSNLWDESTPWESFQCCLYFFVILFTCIPCWPFGSASCHFSDPLYSVSESLGELENLRPQPKPGYYIRIYILTRSAGDMFPNTTWEAQILRIFVHHTQRLKEDISWRPSTLLLTLNLLKWLFLKNWDRVKVWLIYGQQSISRKERSHTLGLELFPSALVTVGSDTCKFPLFLFPFFLSLV